MNNILKYFPKLTDNQIDKFTKLYEIYLDWNSKINLVSRKNFELFYIQHVLHSLSIGKFIEFKADTKILDIGTGGGFPAVPISILFPNINILAVDSINKKISVINDVKEKLELKNIETKCIRAEQLNDKVDFVISRAVAPISSLLLWSKGNIHPINFNKIDNGFIFLKGGDLSQEIFESKRKVQITNLSDYFYEDFFETKKIIYIPVK